MAKFLAPPGSYTFNATAKTLTFTSGIPARQALILNVTRARGGLLYQPQQGGSLFTGNSDFGGTWNAGTSTLTFAQDTSAYSNTDDLEVWLDDGASQAAIVESVRYTAVNATADFAVGALLIRQVYVDANSSPAVQSVLWLNVDTGVGIATPDPGDVSRAPAVDLGTVPADVSSLYGLIGPTTVITGSISAVAGTVELDIPVGCASAIFDVQGSGLTLTLVFEGYTGTNWVTIPARDITVSAAFGLRASWTFPPGVGGGSRFVGVCAGMTRIRARCTVFPGGGGAASVRVTTAWQSLVIGSDPLQGGIAGAAGRNGTSSSTSLLPVSGRAYLAGSPPSLITVNASATDQTYDALGRGLTRQTIPGTGWSYAPPANGIIDGTAFDAVSAPAAGQSLDVRGMQITNRSAVATDLILRAGSGGTVLRRFAIPASMPLTQLAFAEPIFVGAALALNLQLSASPGSPGVYINMAGRTEPAVLF